MRANRSTAGAVYCVHSCGPFSSCVPVPVCCNDHTRSEPEESPVAESYSDQRCPCSVRKYPSGNRIALTLAVFSKDRGQFRDDWHCILALLGLGIHLVSVPNGPRNVDFPNCDNLRSPRISPCLSAVKAATAISIYRERIRRLSGTLGPQSRVEFASCQLSETEHASSKQEPLKTSWVPGRSQGRLDQYLLLACCP